MMADCGRHNVTLPADVDTDRVVAPIDALILINLLNNDVDRSLCSSNASGEETLLVDVNNDGWLSPIDALLVINNINEANSQQVLSKKAQFPSSLSEKDAVAGNLILASEVQTLLTRASQASRSNDAIIAVVDRSGNILGVRVEEGVTITDAKELAFAIDGAVAKARTAAFFSSNAAPLTSRTIRFISQSTMTQREVESSPGNINPQYQGPGFVAPIGVGGHFPPEVPFTPQVDLFAIEHQSRDSQSINAGADGQRGTADDLKLANRFNVDKDYVALGAEKFFETWPESYGVASGTDPAGQSRGIATLPGGIPLYKDAVVKDVSQGINLVGGIGVFFPGSDGFATHEQGFLHTSENNGVTQSEAQRTNASRVLESEFIALVAATGGGFVGPASLVRDLTEFNSKLAPLPNFRMPIGRLDLVGITLEVFGPNPTTDSPRPGLDRLIKVGRTLGPLGASSGSDQIVNPAKQQYLGGQPVPERWLVIPHDSSVSSLKAAHVEQMIHQAIAQAELTRAAIRLTDKFRPGARTSMVISVADTNGELLGVYRMPDATVFSIDVSVAKARNTAYYADAQSLQAVDRVDFNQDGVFGTVTTSLTGGDTLPLGTALTNRTFRFLAEPRYPTGIEFGPVNGLINDPNKQLIDQRPDIAAQIGPFSILQLPGIHPKTGENLVNDVPLSIEVYASASTSSPVAFDAFNPSRNFRDPGDEGVMIAEKNVAYPLANQNGIVFFPGSTPVYVGGSLLAGGLGVSGDGVDQDDVVTAYGQIGFAAPDTLRVDNYSIGSVRLPFQKFNRNPNGA
ncbi:MAG: hypothetical protein IT423_14015 [Pirellulaceae bacterium]|nr:hypothetical protein [Pirellulaceae bacterium]